MIEGDPAMNQEHGLQPWPRAHRTGLTTAERLPVLIEVPALSSQWQGPGRRHSQQRPRVAVHRPRRRRLRREVRMAVYGLLLMITLAGAPSLFRAAEMTGWIGSGMAAAAPGTEAYDASPPTVSITI